MIAKLTGIIDTLGEDQMVLDVAGVGYLVFCSAQTLRRMGRAGEAASLAIETHVREDHIHLYGFADTAERDWFRLLTTVQGVGARVALAILSALAPADLAQAVAAQDKAAVSRAQGVGAKLAQRIVGELKDKAAEMVVVRHVDFAAGKTAEAIGPVEDAVSALVNLGFGRSDAFGAVALAAGRTDETPSVEALVKAGLKELSA